MSAKDPVFMAIVAAQLDARKVISLNAERFLARVADNVDATPRASWHVNGVGYWIVRSRRADGYILQGVGLTQGEAWDEWRKLS